MERQRDRDRDEMTERQRQRNGDQRAKVACKESGSFEGLTLYKFYFQPHLKKLAKGAKDIGGIW